MKTRAVIVDDEPLARQRLRDLLADEADFIIAGECADGAEALERIGALQPDVVFLDVQMPGPDGFDVLRALEPPLPMIVFTTAFEQYAVRAFDASAVDYLLKPLDASRFGQAMARLRRRLHGHGGDWPERIEALLSRLERRDDLLRRIVVKDGGRIFFVDVRDVDWFEAAGNYMRLHAGPSTHLFRMTMQALEQRLDRRTFVRIHRSVIVNVQRIAELESRFRGDYAVILKTGAELGLQRAYRDRLRRVMGDF